MLCLHLYIYNKYTQYTHILCKQKPLFWMRVIELALINIHEFQLHFKLLYCICMIVLYITIAKKLYLYTYIFSPVTLFCVYI